MCVNGRNHDIREMYRPGETSSVLPLIVGGAAGGSSFALCVFLFGAPTGIAIALAGALLALARRASGTALLFALAAVICAIALKGSTIAILLSAVAFGAALLRSAWPRPAVVAGESEHSRTSG